MDNLLNFAKPVLMLSSFLLFTLFAGSMQAQDTNKDVTDRPIMHATIDIDPEPSEITITNPDGTTSTFSSIEEAWEALEAPTPGVPHSGGLIMENIFGNVMWYVRGEDGSLIKLISTQDGDGESGNSGLWVIDEDFEN